MLCSSGFFRGIECPYGQACGRPYCHFRHPPGAQHTSDGPIPPRRLLALSAPDRRPATLGGCGYDPYNPELPKPVAQDSNGTLENIVQSASGILELELFDKAIEAAKNEVEREQKKYEELLETAKEYGSSEPPLLASKAATSNSFSSLEYNPGSYNANSDNDYNPTPLTVAAASQSSKYTLDSFNNTKCKGSSLEYIPTVVTQPKKYSSPVVNSKYIIDNSKPSTDLEYDPLSNYSARLLSKAKEQKGTKRKREVDHEEAYSPSFKKYCDETSNDEPLARFSDSEDECQEASTIPLKSKGGSESKLGAAKEKGTPQIDTSSRQMKETAVQYDMGDIESPQGTVVKDLVGKNAKLVKVPSNRDAKAKEKNKAASKDKLKKKNDHKAQGKKNLDKIEDKETMDMKAQHKNGERSKEKQSKSHIDRHGLKLTKSKSVIPPGIEEENSGKSKDVGKAVAAEKSGTSRKNSKLQAVELKRKPQISSETEHNKRKDKQPALKRSKETLTNSQAKENSRAKCRVKQRALSHVDLFGDESGEEEQVGQPLLPFPDVNSDSDRDDADLSFPCYDGIANVKKLKLSQAPAASSSSDDEIDYSGLEKDLDFESDPMEECLRIFNESTDVKTEDKGRLGKQLSKEEGGEEKLTEDSLTTLFPGQKRRISHVTKQGHVEVPSKPVIRPYRPPTAQEVCYQRIQLAQKQAAQLAQQRPQQPLPTTKLPVAPRRTSIVMHKGERKRIAHVPSAALSAVSNSIPGNLKKIIPPASVASSNGVDASGLKARTLTGMASKTTTASVTKRIAHTPTLQSTTLQRPVIPTEYGAKVPTNIRQRYLNLFIDECSKFCPSQQGAFDKALAEEKVVYERSTSRNIYLNVAVNTLKKLRTLLPSPSQEVQKASNRKLVSHEAMLGGKLAARTSYTLNRSTSLRLEDLTGATLYRRLKEYVLTEDDLKEHGYPLPCPERPGRAVVFAMEEKKLTDGSCRICCRCGTEYMVTSSGNCVRKEECIHHWGRLRKQRVPGGWETHYNCCSGAVGSLGCQIAKQHVHDGRKESLEGFVKTFEKLPRAGAHPGIYALDCEMCYTKQGLELTRVTVINSDLKVIYDTFVKPDSKVVDYNTRFSGVTEADLENASITLRDVQAVLLSMFSTETILIGHSLESDLFALKLIHSMVVDTAVVFPHRLGLPYKRALRTLMADYLKRIIQDSVEGHDSSEDARACMELMIWKIKEDAKVKR
ncbi:RNA exonuclease 1 homolog [Protobothrops mucrosquamatus]|uniref:RNA exonuclease 1 homolog n=1 Tax=Protobothrops mucrosquamatus TaxID=103944 RepID=UPI0010FAD4C6|nr:RNA exonuclease 1 homolog [Protobothrops mucrosquamatus]